LRVKADFREVNTEEKWSRRKDEADPAANYLLAKLVKTADMPKIIKKGRHNHKRKAESKQY